MARLTELPSELLLNVILYLTTRHPSDVRTLLHLCLTSRLLCDIARPALYKCVQIKEPGGEPLRPSKHLFRTLLEHPSLAQKVHEFTLRNDLLAGFRPPNIGKDAIVTEISRVLRDLGLEMETDFCRYPLATDILARLPNLKHLEITARVEQPRAFVRRLHQLQTSRSILANLKSFYLCVIGKHSDQIITDKAFSESTNTGLDQSTSENTYLSCNILHSKDFPQSTSRHMHLMVLPQPMSCHIQLLS